MLTVTWFRNDHEFRNDYIRMALMRAHDRGELAYRERTPAEGRELGLPDALATREHRHTSLFVVEEGGRRQLCAIDNEDGFIHLQGDLLEAVDVYFCCPYTAAFHRDRGFPEPLPWQTEFDIAPYREKAAALVERLGDHFGKIRPLILTPTSMSSGIKAMTPDERARQIRAHRLRKLAVWRGDRELWRVDQQTYEARYRQMVGYRAHGLRHDVVSRESLWGWPENRIALHRRLHTLKAEGRDVYARLTPLADTHDVTKNELHVSEASLALLDTLTGDFGLDEPYEEALASSRLGVFPTGFHWGWRGIAFLALCMGIPTYQDRAVYEPYFDFGEFEVETNEGTWDRLRELLDGTSEADWTATKAHNQRVFDECLAPDAVAAYLISSLRA